MKTEPSKTIREVWAIKEAAYQEARHLTTAKDYFGHIRARLPKLNLPRVCPKPRHVVTPG